MVKVKHHSGAGIGFLPTTLCGVLVFDTVFPRLLLLLFLLLLRRGAFHTRTHNFVTLSHTHYLSRTTLPHTRSFTHYLSRHNFVTHYYLSHTIFHTLSFTKQLCPLSRAISHTLFCHTQLCHIADINLRFAWQAWHLWHWAGWLPSWLACLHARWLLVLAYLRGWLACLLAGWLACMPACWLDGLLGWLAGWLACLRACLPGLPSHSVQSAKLGPLPCAALLVHLTHSTSSLKYLRANVRLFAFFV